MIQASVDEKISPARVGLLMVPTTSRKVTMTAGANTGIRMVEEDFLFVSGVGSPGGEVGADHLRARRGVYNNLCKWKGVNCSTLIYQPILPARSRIACIAGCDSRRSVVIAYTWLLTAVISPTAFTPY